MKNTKSYLKLLNDIQEEIPSLETLDIKDERKKIKSELIRKKQKRHIFSDNSKIDLIYSDFSSDSKKTSDIDSDDISVNDSINRLFDKLENTHKNRKEKSNNKSSSPKLRVIDILKNELERKSDKEKKQVKKNNYVVNSQTKSPTSLYEMSRLLLSKVNIFNWNGTLYFFNGKCYDPALNQEIIQLYREKVDDRIDNATSMYTISHLEKFLLTDSSIRIYDFDCNKRITVLNNCIYDVEQKQKFRHSSDILAFSYINANYVETPYCRHFDSFLESVFDNDPILIKRMWMILGYLIMQTNEAKKFFIMGEAPDSGKSLLGNFIQSLFPRRYVSNLALNDFNSRFGMVRLVGSAVNISLDLPSSKLNQNAVSRIKMLTGGDMINVEEKFKPVFQFKNQAKLLFGTNFPISITEQDEAFWNRLVYIPFRFSVPPEEQDGTLFQKFQNEKDSIVSKALKYANKLIKNNFNFPSTTEIDIITKQWKTDEIPTIDYFVKEYCIVNPEYKGELASTLYTAYEIYCNRNGLSAKSHSSFKNYLEKNIGLKHLKMRNGGKNPQSSFKGIKLNFNINNENFSF